MTFRTLTSSLILALSASAAMAQGADKPAVTASTVAAATTASAATSAATSQVAPPDDPRTAARAAWFREARFGMFIHWGLYAVPAGVYQGKDVPGIGEWIMHKAKIPVPEYEKFAAEFNPKDFDARKWVQVAKDAGMKYIVITSKHHDGFCMFDSKLTDYTVTSATAWKRDPLKDLAAACREQGIKLCFYYSIMDWHHPDAKGENWPKYFVHLKGQVKELLTQYGDIGILWFDGQWDKSWTIEQARELQAYIRSLQPNILINNRIGKKWGDGDYDTPEQKIPKDKLPSRLWETCMTMNDTWGYKTKDQHWKSAEELIEKLADIASKGGNFLLNVGPDARGIIPPESAQRLREVGAWMKTNGEAIYGTTSTDLPTPAWGRITRKGNALYLIVFSWPKDGRLEVPATVQATGAALLGSSEKVALASGERLTLTLPAAAPSSHASVIRLTFTGPLKPAATQP